MRIDRPLGYTTAALLLAVSTSAVAQGARPQYSLDDWMTVTSVSSFVWAPDGSTLYFTSDAGNSDTDEIFRVASSGGQVRQVSSSPPGVRPEPKQNLAIAEDGKTIYFTSSQYFQNIDDIFSLPVAGGAAKRLTFNDAIIETAPEPSPDGKRIAYFTRTARGTKILLLDVTEGVHWPQLFDPSSAEERNPVWSPDGSKLAFARQGDTWIRDVAGGEPRRLVAPGIAGSAGSPVWSPDGARVAFTNGYSGFSQIGIADVATGRVVPITYTPYDHDDISWSPDGKWVAYIASDGLGMSRQVEVAASDGSAKPKVLTSGPGIRKSPRFSPDGRTIAYIETTARTTADIWAVPAGGGKPRQITNSMGRINPASLSVPEEITYRSVDNLAIPAMLYRPMRFDPNRKYPVIVRLHGHPGQWNNTMNLMEHYFLDRGFVIVAPNPRGSRGFGQGYHDLHVGDYGGTEFEDIMRVVPFLETLPYVDMARKATWGGSGGGYMSFVVATEAPTVFQAQVIRAPVSSWQWLATERYVSPARFATPTREPQRAREEFGGAYTDIPERYNERSPLNFVEHVQVPQLLMQGMRDGAVPPNESRRWAKRMKELGKSNLLQYVEYPDEDHTLNRYRATIRNRLERMQGFFAERLRLPELQAKP
ncbi:MAG TPA: S9 family peptidase [Gemmatimonadaceae bacterium]